MAKRDWHLWGFLLLLVFSALLKYPFWGVLSYGEHHWWSAYAINFAANWVDEGYLSLKGLTYLQAASSEFLEPASRALHHLTSTFFVLPIFWIAKVTGSFPSIWMVNLLGFVLHAALAYLSAALAYSVLSDFKEKYRRIAFLSTAISVLFTYKIFYLYSVVYWADHIVLIFIAGILYCEFLIHPKNKVYTLHTYQQILILCACLLDHYGFVFSLVLFSYFVYQRDLKRSLQTLYPIALASVITAFYLSNLGSWDFVKAHLLGEIGLRLGKNMTIGDLFAGVFTKHLGFYAFGFLLAFGFAEYLQRKKILTSKLMFLFFAPPVIYAFLYANKSLSIEFSALKFYFPTLIFIGGVFPACLLSYIQALPKKKKIEKRVGYAIAAFPVALTLALLGAHYNKLLKENLKDIEEVRRLQWIKSVSKPEQVIFSNDIMLSYLPPQGTYYLRKPIWRFAGRVGLTTWQRIFNDSLDYPLLWLEVDSENTAKCIPYYLAAGAQKVGSYKNIQAFLFLSVKSFSKIPASQLELCIKIPKAIEHSEK